MPYCETCGKKIRRGARFCVAHHREGVRDYARRRRADLELPHRRRFDRKEECIRRQCLKCDRPFMAQGRFNRICESCTKTNQDL